LVISFLFNYQRLLKWEDVHFCCILRKVASLLCTAFFIEASGARWTSKIEFYGRVCCFNNKKLAVRDLIKYWKRKDLRIELCGEARLAIRSVLDRLQSWKWLMKPHFWIYNLVIFSHLIATWYSADIELLLCNCTFFSSNWLWIDTDLHRILQ
jgi:hypothetical protein